MTLVWCSTKYRSNLFNCTATHFFFFFLVFFFTFFAIHLLPTTKADTKMSSIQSDWRENSTATLPHEQSFLSVSNNRSSLCLFAWWGRKTTKEMLGFTIRGTYAPRSAVWSHKKTSVKLWMCLWTGARLRREAAFSLVLDHNSATSEVSFLCLSHFC